MQTSRTTCPTGRSHVGRVLPVVLALICALALGSAGLGPGQALPAAADTAPTTNVPVTISADALPTVQVDGVVWAQVVVGDRVYATGEFTAARPAGSAPGRNLTRRSNLLAYSITTGKLITSWAPELNAQGRTVTASPDGRRIYVGGDFTRVDGKAHNRIVALDATTGAVQPFGASVNSTVNALAVSGSTLYAGGSFSSAGGAGRSRLAAFTTGTGALTSWAPAANGAVLALLPLPTKGTVVIGGKFTTLNGSPQPGMGAVHRTTGGTRSWPVNTVVRNSGSSAAIGSLSLYGAGVYATGWSFSDQGNFESAVRTDLDGNLVWVSGCHGDTYGLYPLRGVLYTVGHAHDCGPVPGGFVQDNPDLPRYRRAVAFSTSTAGTNGTSVLENPFLGRPAPRMLHWLPTFADGTYTGQHQGPWSVTGNDDYVVMGGEFPTVNGTPQQGLVRMAVRELAPDEQGPRASPAPRGLSPAPGSAYLTWTSTWDRDSSVLSYDVYRGSTFVGRVRASNGEYPLQTLSFTDTGVPAGVHSYTVRVHDNYGNALRSSATPIAVAGGPAVPRSVTAWAAATVDYRTVTAKAASYARGSKVAYSWNFGDGKHGTGASAKHTYAKTGRYTVKLTAKAANGAKTTATTWVVATRR